MTFGLRRAIPLHVALQHLELSIRVRECGVSCSGVVADMSSGMLVFVHFITPISHQIRVIRSNPIPGHGLFCKAVSTD